MKLNKKNKRETTKVSNGIDKIKDYVKRGEQDEWVNFSWDKLVKIIANQIKKGVVSCKDLMLPTILCALGIENDNSNKENNLGLFLSEIENSDKALEFLLNFVQYTGEDYKWIVDFFTNNSYGLAGVYELNKMYLKFIEKLYKEKEADWILWSLICLINYDEELLPIHIEESESVKNALRRRYTREDSFPAPLIFIRNLLES
jgi:hypothetical protein